MDLEVKRTMVVEKQGGVTVSYASCTKFFVRTTIQYITVT